MLGEGTVNPDGEFKISFGYQCNAHKGCSCLVPNEIENLPGKFPRNSSFSRLSGAALSANATLANTNICNGVIREEILPSWDSPNSFRRIPSSPSLSRLDVLSSSLQSSMSNLSCSPATPSPPEYDSSSLRSMSSPSRNEGFLNAMEVQVAGGAAGEDRVQAVCSEENDCELKKDVTGASNDFYPHGPFQYAFEGARNSQVEKPPEGTFNRKNSSIDNSTKNDPFPDSSDSFRHGMLDSLQRAVSQAENDFLYMVEQEMEDRPDLVSVGSCVLVGLLHGMDLYTLNLGDSRAVLATYDEEDSEMKGCRRLKAIQLTDCHTVDNELERTRVLSDHPDDPAVIAGGKVKGKLKVTRALGVGYLKKKNLNDALMGILRVRNLISPPYISIEPSLNLHRISKRIGSLCYRWQRWFSSLEELMSIPAGRRRKYHDDVTLIVIILGANQRTSKASTWVNDHATRELGLPRFLQGQGYLRG
uniref:PPM-type phosphatase domain-containing protein n=1 Tax=Populus alba TaxID=43335 RepID=A0A4U5QX83_POPAL|nr:hypothetical protein D5086_0000029080 [Populus alba]